MPLRRHPALVALSRDHHHTLALARSIRTGTPESMRGSSPRETRELAEYVVDTWLQWLDPHCRAEEDVLIPAALGHNAALDAACEAISNDHGTMRRIIAALKTADEPYARDLLDQLGTLLERHARFEERELFQLVQEALTDAELDGLAERVERATEAYQSRREGNGGRRARAPASA